ncbi:imidazole glycerol phosphate synthase subunit HisH [Aestuariicella hydrocarbonica]|uniref:Imidazole glycerol phosphate synthase subunit HisH n=1 Tax=Pseudomaricurvus hydrocarbonicus TaxID=1470433 RepID=A0A9E5MNK2_9GAMM|nr:imidazole glycerol phosphate synthase subunit HisH [Aestuariicella hydrocarbonica]NHO67571.1 imidazole glycerol phosphate synthase subunit HisH [Aestuariicella hydrocarbonica]
MSTNRIAVIDYGMGNLHSVASALEHVAPEAEVTISSERSVIEQADRVIFPGVGAIRDCMAEIRRSGFDALVPEVIASGKPVLGICVGMQALMSHSEENGGVECLAQLEGNVRFFGNDLHDEQGEHLKVPHMGWNQVEQQFAHPLWQGIDNGSRFYFVHSYYVIAAEKAVKAKDVAEVAGRCHYGLDFDVALSNNNLFAVQFHPEKSHTAGLQLLKNFVHWDGQV